MIVLVIAHIVILFSLAFSIFKNEQSTLRLFFWPALAVRLAVGVAFGLLYTYYYGAGDTLAYFHDAESLADLAQQNPVGYLRFLWATDLSHDVITELLFKEPRALFFSKLTSVFCLLTGKNYWITGLYFSFIAFTFSWYLIRIIVKQFSIVAPAVLAFLFFPSMLLWTSGIIKEALAVPALFFITGVFLKLYQRDKMFRWEWILLPIMLWILWNLKYYYLAVLLPVMITLLVLRLIPAIQLRSWPVKLLIACGVFIVPLYVVGMLHPNFYPERLFDVIVTNYYAMVQLSTPQDVVIFSGLEPTAGSILQHSPKAIATGLFRPFLWEASNVLQTIASLENLFLLLMALTAAYKVVKTRVVREPELMIGILLYCILLSVFLTLSTPNYGTLSRYRVGFLPFFVFVISLQSSLVYNLTEIFQRTVSRLVPK
ncbi:MAG TPA: hypothetical protein VD884_03420 [Ohtaekwangia sp.]|nr:hypothetical protein [Ohtaekwangia sp.]